DARHCRRLLHDARPILFAGSEGLDDYRRIIPDLRRILAPEGRAFLEIGHAQGEVVRQIAAEAGFSSRPHRDLAGHFRCVELWKRSEEHTSELQSRANLV